MKTTTNEVPQSKDVCYIDLFAGENGNGNQCRLYLSPLVYVPLLFKEELVEIENRRGEIGLMRMPTRLLLPFQSMDFVRRDSGIVDVQFRLPNVQVLEAKDCPFAN